MKETETPRSTHDRQSEMLEPPPTEPQAIASLSPSEYLHPQAQRYEYLPLKDSEVRLLDLLPVDSGDDQSAISCRLYHVSIDNLPTYEALSYS